ncbi:sporulation histidine kinase inhibitor Sda [Metabacillus sediminilitoris]|uniref:Sporulation histidine kinase inhibitor Sda n=1 Tax=Metabacillus sediminilitoris TaxID=2567941 RepID=A0A4S4BW22_9BACI|nr:sporulation histidine kinase inhibitor Sda [Metabacillus sediminilitoris]QGQ46323.1 sporulation histidine kinase inhibitor Sda [Metabacillus sediminilitoris]THF79372.1 sporulation histidine kinase inhibitor Sda [Metabacillus sediminilitoris]
MSYSWFYVEDELLINIYRKSVEQNLDKEFIEFVFTEIKGRDLVSEKPVHLLRIK